MNYPLIKDVIALTEDFEKSNHSKQYSSDINGFKLWFSQQIQNENALVENIKWSGKDKGRTPESVINTLINHMSHYAKTYSKSAIVNSNFSTQEEFIYLINLKAFGSMTKTDLIRKNIHEKPVGMQIIKRLIQQGWVKQEASRTDKRSKLISITSLGLEALEAQMGSIRVASQIVTGNLNYLEKLELIRLLQKLDAFHNPIYLKNIPIDSLLDYASQDIKALQN